MQQPLIGRSEGRPSRARWVALGLITASFVLVLLLAPTISSLFIAHSRLLPPSSKLLLVQAVFRHGARTPLNDVYWPETRYENCNDSYAGVNISLHDEHGSPYPPPILDPTAPKLPGGCKQGQLTSVGYQMALDFGAWLRDRYVRDYGFLSSKFQPDEVALRTTCVRRAQQTLQGVVTGLFPGAQQPASVVADASQESYEYMYGKNSTCPRLGPIFANLSEAVAARDAGDPESKELADRVHERLKLPQDVPMNWNRLRDSVFAMVAEGLPLPPVDDQGEQKELMHIIDQQGVAHEMPIIAPLPSDGFLDARMCGEVLRYSLGPLVFRLLQNIRNTALASEAAFSLRANTAPATVATASTASSTSPTATDVGTTAATAAAASNNTKANVEAQAAEIGVAAVGSAVAASAAGGADPLAVAGVTKGNSEEGSGGDGWREKEGGAVASMSRRLRMGSSRQRQQEQPNTTAHTLAARYSPSYTPQMQHLMFLFSGHDSTISPLLAMLGTPATVWPPFMGNLVFELWQQDTSFVVRVLYNQVPLVVPGANQDGFLSVVALEHLLGSYAVSDHEHAQECKLGSRVLRRGRT